MNQTRWQRRAGRMYEGRCLLAAVLILLALTVPKLVKVFRGPATATGETAPVSSTAAVGSG